MRCLRAQTLRSSRGPSLPLFMAHGVSDFASAQQKAIVALGQTVKRQALVMAFSDTFAVIGVMLAIAAVVLVFARKGKAAAGASGAH